MYSDLYMRAVFSEGSINVKYRKGKNLKELTLPFHSLQPATKSQSLVTKYGKKCDVCDNVLQCKNEFTCNPAGIYLLKVNNRNTRTRCVICSKLTIKTPERRH